MYVYFLVNCVWSDWGNWTDCSCSCGGGNRTSQRKIIQEALYNGNECLGNDTRIETCNDHPCPGTPCIKIKRANVFFNNYFATKIWSIINFRINLIQRHS